MEVDQRSQWEKYLPLVEYAYNNTVHTSIGKAPFEVIEGRSKSPLLLKVHGKIFAADEYSRDLKESFQKIKEAISISQQKQKAAANKHKRALAFKENDWVLLKFPKARLRHTLGKNPTGHQKYYAKLAKRYYGPFQILKPINEMTYQLKLPNHWLIHNAFHVSLLKPYKGEPPSEAIMEDPPEVEDQEEVLQPESILRHEDKEKRDALEDEAKLLIAQQAFMDKATKFIQREGRASMVPTPPATASTLKPIAFVGGSCAACGKPLSANHMAGVFLLTCQHKYHPFCFAVLCATKTKDGSCCLDSYDEDHSDHSDSFEMKGTASEDTANVLQGMAKVTTENSPILVLEEPSGKMDNASTLVEDKGKNSTMDPHINFSIDVPPVHEGEDHEKNTTLDPVSKVSTDSAEGDHGKDKIVDPASKLSVDTPKEPEATDDMDDPELGETLRFMAAQMKKKRKQELEEGPANPNRIKIRVVNYPSSKSLDDSETPINIDRVPPVYRSLGRADACNDASRPAIILDLNNVLMITHRKSRDPLPPNVSSLYFYIIKDQEDQDITYYVRADAVLFILHVSQLAEVFIWSSCTLTNLSRRIDRCFSQVKVCFSGWAGQEMCHRASWQMGEKPVFFKSMETGMQGLGKYSTILLDDSSYKNHLNEKGTYVVLPGIEQQSEEQWDGFLRNDVLQFLYTWVDAKEEDHFKIVKECNFDVSESVEQCLDMLFIKRNLEGGGTIHPPRNSGLHENPKPKNPGSAAGDPGSASGSPRKRGHLRPQYKRPGTQWHK
ncbi:hypothetical protein L7F22_026812 [Adiantum nelumboides]|nr:hypothetical protein [Adiantum nelumboides]